MGNHGGTKFVFLVILCFTGLVIAILSALEGRIEGLSSFCGFFGDGCIETAQFKFLWIPIWLWGIVFYIVLTGALLFVRPAVFWLVMMGMGVELSLLWILVSMKLKCVFCLMNAGVVVLLFIMCLEKKRVWQAMAVSLLVFPVSNFLIAGKGLGNAQADPANPADSIVAKVGENTISVLELESPLASKIYELQQNIYLLKYQRLEELVIENLISQEAEKKGVTIQQLVESTSPARELVTEAEIENYYQENRSRFSGWKGTMEDLREQIRRYLQSLKDREQMKKMTDPMRERYSVEVYLKEPPLPFSNVSVGESPVLGPVDAHVTVVEFSDYLCPVCHKAHEITKEIREAYAGRIRWVFKDYPLKRHPGADKLAEAAQCAGEQDKFWEFQDLIFAASKRPEFEELIGYARQLDMNVDQFTQCYENGKYVGHVEKDIQTAWEAGVGATPSFIINGRLKPGSMPLAEFKNMIDEELKKYEEVSVR